jgi:hypothetical protein
MAARVNLGLLALLPALLLLLPPLPASAAVVTHDMDVSGVPSFDGLGDPANTLLLVPFAPHARVTGLGWNVNLRATAPSWLSEISFLVTNSSGGGGFILLLGFGANVPGAFGFASAGVIDLTAEGLDLLLLADGILRLEAFEGVDDLPNAPDGQWLADSMLTWRYETTAGPAIPEPGSLLLLVTGLAALGGLARRSRAA